MMAEYDDWGEPILARDNKAAWRECKRRADSYSQPGYPVELMDVEHEDQPKGATNWQPNFRCKFRSHNQ